jgi:beta-1,2-mannobiose phosphorylase / 1,2-beta-oligomannan phosphorylase
VPITVSRKDVRYNPDPTRIIPRFHSPAGSERTWLVIDKVLELSDEEINLNLNSVLRNFSKRHRSISRILNRNFERVKQVVDEIEFESMTPPMNENIKNLKVVLQEIYTDQKPESKKKKLLIGAYFTMEYSIESAAFFNPAIVEHPDQAELQEKGQKRVIISFRATGEGHISSIVFREGVIDEDNTIHFNSISKIVDVPEVVKRHVYNKSDFFQKLQEMHFYKTVIGVGNEPPRERIEQTIKLIMDNLEEKFIYGKLRESIEKAVKNPDLTVLEKRVIEAINWLADSHYEIEFSQDTSLSERVIFPVSYSERNGIEDARFVRFTDDDGSVSYNATYTAYDGYTILPKLIQTKDFCHFIVKPLNGIFAQNKGMALFPRRIKGKYIMLSRHDGVNNYILDSDNINLWQHSQKIESPINSWEFVQTGNCGSPIETDRGWLVLTHGVGTMRKYCIGALLLDLEDPTKVLGHLKEPLLSPNEEEREGYVPNVVYSCGSIVHNNELILPYGISDTASTYATISMDELLSELLESTSKT